MRSLTVSQITGHIKDVLESDPDLHDAWIEGEVSNFVRSANGHCYFTLKDAAACLRCVMWRSTASRLLTLPRNGDSVIVRGNISLYESRGDYQLYVDTLFPAGIGNLYLQFEAIKQRLEGEGLFDEDHKRPLPEWPEHIGVVTSPTGAALRDVIHVLSARWPLARLLLAPALVQGAEAAPSVIEALRVLADYGVDIILIVRGGGSIEDLWAFNDESLVRAVARCPVPVISGVGHETDITLLDLVADLRAPTPSAAAMRATPDRREIADLVAALQEQLTGTISERLQAERSRLAEQGRTLARVSPAGHVTRQRQRVDDLTRALAGHLAHHMALRHERLTSRRLQLASLDPRAVLMRGYALVQFAENRQIIRHISQVRAGDRLLVRLADGTFGAIAEP